MYKDSKNHICLTATSQYLVFFTNQRVNCSRLVDQWILVLCTMYIAHGTIYIVTSYQLKLEKVRGELVNLNHCAVPHFKPRRRQLVLVLLYLIKYVWVMELRAGNIQCNNGLFDQTQHFFSLLFELSLSYSGKHCELST